MGKDYYAILGVSKDADDDALKKAYRKQALKWHPDRHQGGDKSTAEQKFKDISEAFEALSDKNKRAVYDQYGEEGLKGGMGGGAGGAGGFPGGFSGFPGGGGGQSFHFTSGGSGGGGFGGFTPSNPEDIFAQLFSGLGGMGGMGGGHGVHTHRGRGHHMDVDDDMGGGFSGMPGGMRPQGRTQEVTRPLPCTLEELYNGCTKKLKVTRRTLDRSSGQLVSSEKILQISVRPGWKAGTKVRFSGEGDDFGHGGQDIVFVVEAKPHAVFKRDGDNLHMDMELSLDEALCGFKRPVKTLSGKSFMVANKTVVKPGQVSQMDGYGMPISKQPGTFGKLIINYKVAFPMSLTDSQKEKIHAALTQ
ncbi:Molecular chaperone (DnaJ super) [Linderina macrospora]|uniref:Molecular chaperone (DnaJ super) n=1 Tax=Linderina macrospora TaxID=4868 RepID=A0ACC1J693_9FUNG|nr:Molecular chaperone (DnaJ super) [Linderina macrospora]